MAEPGTVPMPWGAAVRPACRVQSRMSMDSSALLSGTDSLRLGEGFSAVPVIRNLTESAQP